MNNVPSYHYYLRDHLGSNRMVVSGDGTIEQKNQYYPYGGPWGDISTNQGLQPFKYNGKELDRVHGLDWYDYGARRYDPAFGRFLSPAPYVQAPDFTQNFNRYSYCLNNLGSGIILLIIIELFFNLSPIICFLSSIIFL